MKIILSLRESNEVDVPPSVVNDVLTYRGENYDFSQLTDGAQVEVTEPFRNGLIKRVNGQVELVLDYRYSTETAETNQSSNLEDYTFIVENGQCPDPILYKPEPESINDPIIESEVESEI